MAELAGLSDTIYRCTGGGSGSPENLFFFKDARVAGAAAAATIAGRFTSLWQYDGQPSHGAAPTTVADLTNTSDGGIKQTDPGGGRTKWNLGAVACPLVAGALVLYDRIRHIGGLDGRSTGAQTVGGGALPRYVSGADCIGNQIWVEIYTLIGASGTTITASYTNQGAAGKTTQATVWGGTGFREATRLIVLPLASGDSGVAQVASVTALADTGTTGNFGVTIARPLLIIPLGLPGAGSIRDLIAMLPGPQEIKTDACLAWAWFANGTTAPQIFGSLHCVEA